MNNTAAAIIHLHLRSSSVADDRQREAILDDAVDGLQRRIRRRDHITRHRGNVAIVLTDLAQSNAQREARQIATALAADLSTLIFQPSTDPVTVSIGISTFPADGHKAVRLIELADSRSLLHLPISGSSPSDVV